jgi:hypothetical protein
MSPPYVNLSEFLRDAVAGRAEWFSRDSPGAPEDLPGLGSMGADRGKRTEVALTSGQEAQWQGTSEHPGATRR